MKKSFNGPEMNKHVEGFDLTMEVLCSIPPSPAFVECSTLLSDFNIKSQGALSDMFKELKSKKMLVVRGISPNTTKTTGAMAHAMAKVKGRVYTIPKKNDNWVNVEKACIAYWDKVVDPQAMPVLSSTINHVDKKCKDIGNNK